MRNRTLITLLAAAACLVAAPAGAQGALTIGIAENQPSLFDDPLFTSLGAKHSRVVMSYNVMTSGDDELQRVSDYLNKAQAAGVEPLVTFEHARGAAEICKKASNRRKSQCKLPTAKQYETNIRAFFARFPFVKTVAPFNEINHFTQPTSRNPAAAARFSDIVRKNCADCKIVVADILDQADSTKSKRPTYKSTVRYIQRFRKALKSPRNICGLHNYSDTNRFRDTGTKAIIKALGCKEIWLTETGGIYKFASFKASQSRQLKATKYMFTLANRNKRIKRLYIYTWFGNVTPRFDAGLVADGVPRSSYNEVKKRIG